MWTSSSEWAEASQQWADTAFLQLAMPALEASITSFAAKLNRMEQGLPANQVHLLTAQQIVCRPFTSSVAAVAVST